jgi:hypothetical protein
MSSLEVLPTGFLYEWIQQAAAKSFGKVDG